MKTKKIRTIYKIFALAMLAFFVKFSPLMDAWATGMTVSMSTAGSSTTMTNVVKWVAAVIGGVVAILLMVSIAKDAVQYAKGGGSVSIPKIIGKVVFMLVMIAIIFIAANYKDAAQTGQTIAQTGLNAVSTAVQESSIGK